LLQAELKREIELLGGTEEDMDLLYEDPKAANNLEDEMVRRPWIFFFLEAIYLVLRSCLGVETHG